MPATPVRCVACGKFTLKAHRGMAEMGFGRCSHGIPGAFVSASRERTCDRYQAVEPAVAADRQAWMGAQRQAAAAAAAGTRA